MATATSFRTNGIAAEPLGFEAARDEMLRLTRQRYIATLATASPEIQPQASPMRYAVTDDFEIVMGTLQTSRKFANLQRNPKVAVLVWDGMFSIQIDGIFDLPSGADLERLRDFFAHEQPLEARIRAGRPTHVYFRIRPLWARYSDFMVEPGRVLTLDFERQAETRGTWPVVPT
jgi:hypothetical protein